MKRTMLTLVILSSLTLMGCSGKFWGGAAGGVLGTGAGYEYNAKKEIERIQKELDEGKITQEEFNARKDQIERMSITR